MKIENDSLLPFLCVSTGKCCIHNIVVLSPFDIFRIAKGLNVTSKELFEKKILTYKINQTNFWMEVILNTKDKNICPFLMSKFEIDGEKFFCSIYENRPLVCRIYPLKFEPRENSFYRFFQSEERCRECINPEKLISTKDYLDSSSVNLFLKEFEEYNLFKEKIIHKNFHLMGIKNNKEKQKQFFEIQKILYESYPNKIEDNSELPFKLIQEKVNLIMEDSE